MRTNGSESERPFALVILDGWGYAPRTDRNAIAAAHTPYYDSLCRQFPMTTLAASGLGIGLADDDPGSPEVGHLNLGTGRPARTVVSKLRRAISTGEFINNETLKGAFTRAANDGSAVHLIGLVSDGGVHSSIESLFALLRIAKQHGLKDVFVHCILDGVDVPPRTAGIYLEALEIKMADIGLGRIASVCGRFFAMDADSHWERTARAFTMLVHGEGERAVDAVTAVRNSFLRGISDEFIAPIVIEGAADVPTATVRNSDLVVFFNHRADTMRQLVRSLSVPEGASAAKPMIDTVCLTEYDRAFGLPVAFPHEPEINTLADVLSENLVPITKVTETSRYPHLTTFFDGGTDISRALDQEILISGTTPAVPDHQPESQSFKIADRLLRGIERSTSGLFVANLPAADIMAETGDFARTVAAIQYMDTCIGGICEMIERRNGVMLITAAHGRCEAMDEIHGDDTRRVVSSTANPVPMHLIDHGGDWRLSDDGTLADVAPTILGLMGLEKPPEMTGRDLRVR